MTEIGNPNRPLQRAGVLDSEPNEWRRRFDLLVQNLNGMVYRCANDALWSMEYVSVGAEALTGYRPEQLIGNAEIGYGELIHSGDRERVWADIQAALAARRAFRLTYRIRDRFGNEKWVWEQGVGVPAADGSVAAAGRIYHRHLRIA